MRGQSGLLDRLLRLGLCSRERRPRSVSARSALVCVRTSRCLPPCQALRVIMRKPHFETPEQLGSTDTESPRQSGPEITQSGRGNNRAIVTDHPEYSAFLRPTEDPVLLQQQASHDLFDGPPASGHSMERGSCASLDEAQGDQLTNHGAEPPPAGATTGCGVALVPHAAPPHLRARDSNPASWKPLTGSLPVDENPRSVVGSTRTTETNNYHMARQRSTPPRPAANRPKAQSVPILRRRRRRRSLHRRLPNSRLASPSTQMSRWRPSPPSAAQGAPCWRSERADEGLL